MYFLLFFFLSIAVVEGKPGAEFQSLEMSSDKQRVCYKQRAERGRRLEVVLGNRR